VFDQIRFRLLTAYLLVLMGILVTFAVGVRVLFYHVLSQKITENLTTIAQGTMTSVELKDGRLQFDSDLPPRQLSSADSPKLQKLLTETGLEIFDFTGKRVAQSGRVNLTLPLSIQQPIQVQSGRVRIQGVTMPIVDGDTNKTIGYVRSSQPLTELDENLTKLDLGLGGGILLALIFSSIGGIWLTKQAMHPVESSFQRLQQFTADASHELRSPLMAIKSNAQVALKYPTGIRAGDLDKFESIASATTQMTRLTEDLLWLARTDGSSHQQWMSVELTQVLLDVLRSPAALARSKKIDLQGEIAPELMVTGDRSQLLRVFTNLVENALHYTPDGGIVIVKAERIRQQIIIQIQDTGVGIAPENIPNIFDRFWRADTSRTQWAGGSGLGLAIVQSILGRHDGKITVSSTIGGGSCFTVRLPAHFT
jgi:two-component system, OmpR family, manganese sensing sensor histidine kinase